MSSPAKSPTPVLETRDLVKRFGGLLATDSVADGEGGSVDGVFVVRVEVSG